MEGLSFTGYRDFVFPLGSRTLLVATDASSTLVLYFRLDHPFDFGPCPFIFSSRPWVQRVEGRPQGCRRGTSGPNSGKKKRTKPSGTLRLGRAYLDRSLRFLVTTKAMREGRRSSAV